MRIVLFYHSLISDWNHGNAHFLRGVASELLERGHDVRIYEPKSAWSVQNLVEDKGKEALDAYKAAYPKLSSIRYSEDAFNLDEALVGADLVLVHEWSDHKLVARIGAHHKQSSDYALLFHDTHHRGITDSKAMAAYDLSGYDGVLAFGNILRDLYLKKRWIKRAWTWHEAADARVFYPRQGETKDGDLVWIGNWGDGERSAELQEFLLQPVKELKLKAKIYGVRYPDQARKSLKDAGIAYGGWLPNYDAPTTFARYRVTVHVPRRPYVEALPGIPTIRPFEALACGISLISAPWDDVEHLFTPGEDYLVAENGQEMRRHLSDVLSTPELARSLAEHGRKTILARHTCAHRVDELMSIYGEVSDANAYRSSASSSAMERVAV